MRFLQFAREWPNPLSLVPEFKKTLLQRRNWQITRSLSRHVTLNPERTKVCPPCLVSEWDMGPDAREYSWYLIAPLISQFGFGFAHIPLSFFFQVRWALQPQRFMPDRLQVWQVMDFMCAPFLHFSPRRDAQCGASAISSHQPIIGLASH